MNKLLIAVTLVGLASVPVTAQDAAGRTEIRSVADAVHASVLDAEAMSWAWRIDKAGDIGYKDLETRSAKWGRGEAVRGQLLSKVREIINKGQVRRLTVKEDSDLENANAELRAILSGSRTMAKKSAGQRAEKQAAIDKAAREFLEVEAKHWAWRIAVVRSITYSELKGYSDSWMRGVEVSDELLAKVKVNLESGDTPALSKAEQAKLDAGNKKIKEIVSRV